MSPYLTLLRVEIARFTSAEVLVADIVTVALVLSPKPRRHGRSQEEGGCYPPRWLVEPGLSSSPKDESADVLVADRQQRSDHPIHGLSKSKI